MKSNLRSSLGLVCIACLSLLFISQYIFFTMEGEWSRIAPNPPGVNDSWTVPQPGAELKCRDESFISFLTSLSSPSIMFGF